MSAGIEVERSFVFSPDTPSQIESAGGSNLGTKTISDTYLDNSNFSLLRSNFWLRQRNGRWELKHPSLQCASDSEKNEGRPTSIYNEVENEAEIEVLVKDRLLQRGEDVMTLEKMVSSGILKPFCSLITQRRIFRLEDDITIVLDFEETLEHYVGEIEIMVLDPTSIDEAVSRIDRWSDRLNLDCKGKATSKLAVYLSRFNHEAYDILVKMGII